MDGNFPNKSCCHWLKSASRGLLSPIGRSRLDPESWLRRGAAERGEGAAPEDLRYAIGQEGPLLTNPDTWKKTTQPGDLERLRI